MNEAKKLFCHTLKILQKGSDLLVFPTTSSFNKSKILFFLRILTPNIVSIIPVSRNLIWPSTLLFIQVETLVATIQTNKLQRQRDADYTTKRSEIELLKVPLRRWLHGEEENNFLILSWSTRLSSYSSRQQKSHSSSQKYTLSFLPMFSHVRWCYLHKSRENVVYVSTNTAHENKTNPTVIVGSVCLLV